MKIKDFFIICIKLLGLYLLLATVFSGLPERVFFLFQFYDGLLSIFFIILSIAVPIGLFVVLIFNAETVVRLLQLNKGIETETLDFKKDEKLNLAKIGIFIIGGLLIINNLPDFIGHAIMSFKGVSTGHEYNDMDRYYWIVSTAKVLIGILLITQLNLILRLIKIKTQTSDY